jgi:hypothetical protein
MWELAHFINKLLPLALFGILIVKFFLFKETILNRKIVLSLEGFFVYILLFENLFLGPFLILKVFSESLLLSFIYFPHLYEPVTNLF